MKKINKLDRILIISGFLIIVWLAIILTPLLSNGLFYTIENINKINLLNISFTKVIASLPLTLIMDIAPIPKAVDMPTIVSFILSVLSFFPSSIPFFVYLEKYFYIS